MRSIVLIPTLAFLFSVTLVLSGQDEKKKDTAQDQAASTSQKKESGEPKFEPLFNGTDLAGWDGDPRLWSVVNGVIRGETTAENKANGNTFLIWQGGSIADFELELEFRCNATNNSGIQYRSKHITEKVSNQWVVRGYQHEVRNEVEFPNIAGFIYDEGGSRGRICQVGEKLVWETDGKIALSETLVDQAGFKKLFNLDDWNKVRIVAKGNHIQHYINDRLILDFTDQDPKHALSEGVLALQLHGGAPMWAEFKNIQLKQIKPANNKSVNKPAGK